MMSFIGTLFAASLVASAGTPPSLPGGACQSAIAFEATPQDIEEHEFIKDKVELAGFLSDAVAVAPFLNAFDSSPGSFSYNLATADWDAWSAAITNLDDGLRGILRKHANSIAASHALSNDITRQRYWQCVAASF